MSKKIERKICILNDDISLELNQSIENGTIDFELEVTLENLFLEVDFQDKNNDNNPVVIDVISSKNNSNYYINKFKHEFTIVQVSFFMIEENKRPYLIIRGDNHLVTKGLSILHNLSNLQIDDDNDTVENIITNTIDKMIYIDDNKSYFGGDGFINFFKRNRLKYLIKPYGTGYNDPGVDKANYLFFTYTIFVKDSNLSWYKKNRKYFLYKGNKKNNIFHDIFEIAPNDFEEGFKSWYESLEDNNKIKCKFCFEGSYDISLLESYVYKKEKTKFKRAFFVKKNDVSGKIYISKYENLFNRMKVTTINTIKDNTIKAFMKFPEKIIYGLLSALFVTLLVSYIDGWMLKIIIYFIGAVVLLPVTTAIVEIIFKSYIFLIVDDKDK